MYVFPLMRRFRASCLLVFLPLAALAQPSALSVNTASREEVRQFYRAVYSASEGIPMEWTGSYATGNPGDTSSLFKEAVRLRINFFRALVGVPADIGFLTSYNAAAQQAALMMSANNALSHSPPPSWIFYTAAGANAAQNSNLAIGDAGPDAITGYMADFGANNAAVGHRRWLIFPQTLNMGTGDVPGDASRSPANAVWVIDTTPGGQANAPRPATRTTQLPYPPAGFVPYPLVWPRWSFTHPGADFSAATVTVTRDGTPVATTLEPLAANIGEPTLVWSLAGTNPVSGDAHAPPAADTPYLVNIANVRVGGTTRNFTYTVTVFDPAVPGSDATAASVGGTLLPQVGASNPYTANVPSFAAGFEWRTLALSGFDRTYTAEPGVEDLIASTSPGYAVTQNAVAGSGTSGFRLAHGATPGTETLALPGSYLVTNASAALTFLSRIGFASDRETARVQVSLDDGHSWIDLYAQPGTSPASGSARATETTFAPRTFSLAPYVGRTVRVRFAYTFEGSGTWFLASSSGTVGWFLDDIALSGVNRATPGTVNRVSSGTSFAYAPLAAGPTALQVRGLMFQSYPMEWGLVTPLTAVAGSTAGNESYLSNLSIRSTAGTGAETLIAGFTIRGGAKPLLVRGIGPTLGSFGVSGVLNDPRLALFHDSTQLQANDDWAASAATTFAAVNAFALPAGSRDAALVTSLDTASYTAQVSGAAAATGVALVELYDTAPGTPARLVNVSARARVGTGGSILIAGFTIGGTGSRTLLIRGIGPTLGSFGVSGALANPRLELHGGGGLIAANDNWSESESAGTLPAISGSVGAFALSSGTRDAVLLVSLPPGSYTAQVSGVGNTTGVALVEVYEVGN